MKFMKFIRFTALLAGLVMLPMAVSAQLHENIAVDGTYIRDVIRQDRINTLPSTQRFTLDATPLNFDNRGVATPFAPQLLTVPATVWQGTRLPNRNPGYITAALGSYLNSDHSAGYRFIDTDASLLGAALQFNSTSLLKLSHPQAPEHTIRHLYDGTLSVYGSHTFGTVGTLYASAAYRLAYFNYYNTLLTIDTSDPTTPSNTLNAFDVRLGWRNDPAADQVGYGIGADVSHTAFRALWRGSSPNSPAWRGTSPNSPVTRFHGQQETLADLHARFDYPWADGSHFGADARLDLALYANDEQAPEQLQADNYGNFRLTPYYRFTRGLLNLRLGAHLDFTSGAGKPEDRFPLFHVAPDVRLDWQSKAVGLYLHALGGTQLNTLRRQTLISPYLEPFLLSTNPTYSPLDAALGLNFGPFSGFTAGAECAFKIVRRAPLLGLYTPYLNGELASDNSNLATDNTLNTNGFRFMVKAGYKYGKLLSVNAKGAFMPRKEWRGYFDNLDRARWTADAELTLLPVDPLKLTVSYQLRAGREFFYRVSDPAGQPTVIINGQDSHLEGLRLSNISSLSLRAEWSFSQNFSIFAQGDNLLCRRHQLLPGLPSERLALAAGLSANF